MRQELTSCDKEIVSALRAALIQRVGKERFALWFGGEDCVRLEDDAIVVSAPDQFYVDRLRKQFRRDIESIADQLFCRKLPVEFRIDNSHATVIHSDTSHPSDTSCPVPAKSNPDARDRNSNGERRAANRTAQLDTFVVGDGNRIAFTAATQTPQRLGAVTPLFIYGPAGCGKTHLLQGICHAVRHSGRTRRVLMLSAEQFTTHFLEALQGSGLPMFRRKHRALDLLLIDDVQFFAGKRATLVELQHTIDALLREGRQLVLAADRPPAELCNLGPELTARMSGGLVCGLELPDNEMRLGIARQLAKRRGMNVPEDVLKLLAAELQGDARQISGALNRLQATSQALDAPITLRMAETALEDLFRSTRRVVRIPDIERAVCEVFGLEAKALQSNRKSKTISHPRMLAMWLARKYTRAAFSEIGTYFGRRSHSTVISAQKKVTTWVSSGNTIQLAHTYCNVDDAIRRIEARLRLA